MFKNVDDSPFIYCDSTFWIEVLMTLPSHIVELTESNQLIAFFDPECLRYLQLLDVLEEYKE